MSSFLKSKLKEAREALGKKDYDKAREAATQILDYEPENYNACVKPIYFCVFLSK
jgi:superkiller protein 3